VPLTKLSLLSAAGIDHSVLTEHRSASHFLPNECLKLQDLLKCPPKYEVPQGLFFRQTQARVGSTMTVAFAPATVPPALPRAAAKSSPFGNMEEVLARFDIAPGSDEAYMVRDTLSMCQEPPPAGEHMTCAMSVEATVQSALRMLGTTSNSKGAPWVAASGLPRAGLPRQAYVVEAVAPLDGDRYVGCHAMPFPYAVFQCHMSNEVSKAYVMTLRGLEGGPTVAMAAICHLDTSKWNAKHPSFKMLHTYPGGAPVCHFMPYAHLLFGAKAANA
jgi:hypothetical protein